MAGMSAVAKGDERPTAAGERQTTFDAKRAMAEIVKQVDFGPRIPGSEGHNRARQYFVETLEKLADRVEEQPFTYTDRHPPRRVLHATNLFASFDTETDSTKRILLAAHWDTRPVADQDPEPFKRKLPVPGANDGASGVAVLLEMARLFHARPPAVSVDLALFDLEDMGDDKNPFAIGSEIFARNNPHYRPDFGILLDMVCDEHLRIPKEGYSVANAGPIVQKVWAAARRVGAEAFLDEPGDSIIDDHVAFLRRGIPVIDLIHTPFPTTWHTTADTPERCSNESLQQVGDVLVEVIYGEPPGDTP